MDGIYKLSIVTRNESKSVYESYDENEIMIITVLVCNKLFNRVNNNTEILKRLKKAAKSTNINIVNNILKDELDESLYSLNTKKSNAICIISQENRYKVFFYSETMNVSIIENVSFSRGIIIVRNYAVLLAEFIKLYKKLSIDLDSNNTNYDDLLRVYFTAY